MGDELLFSPRARGAHARRGGSPRLWRFAKYVRQGWIRKVPLAKTSDALTTISEELLGWERRVATSK
jgi:hypothetical protein